MTTAVRDNLKDCLIEAKRLLVDVGWCRGANAVTMAGKRVPYNSSEAVAYDLDGALMKAAGMTQSEVNMFPADPQHALYRNLVELVDAQARPLGYTDAVEFNDSGRVLKGQVLQLLNSAIRERKTR